MSTSDKLNQALQSRVETKNAINKSEVVEITNEPFKAYPDIIREMIKKFKQSIPYKTKTGNPLSINALPFNVLSNKIYGHSEQIVSNGKNLLEVKNIERTINGITFTPVYDENNFLKYINVNGTATKDALYSLNDNSNENKKTINLDANTSYYFNGRYAGDEGILVQGYFNKNGSTLYPIGNFTTGDTIELMGAYINVKSGVTVNNFKVYPQLEKGNNFIGYEPYTEGQVVPSPNYPSQIKNVEGIENLLNIPETLTFTHYKQLNVNIPSGTYYLSCLSEKHFGQNQPVIVFNTSKTFFEIKNNLKQKITIPQNETNVIIYSNGYNYNASDGIEATINQLMISKENNTYVPYGNKYLPININGKNMFNASKGENGYVSDDGSIVNRNYQFASDYIEVKENEEYTILASEQFQNIGVAYFDNNKTIELPRHDNANKKNININIPTSVKYIRFWLNLDSITSLNAELLKNEYNVMMIKRTQTTEYEPYHEPKNYYVPMKKKNWFDGIDLTNGIVPSVSTGQNVNYGNSCSTDYIGIDNTQEQILIWNTTNVTNGKYVMFYDENKNYLGYIETIQKNNLIISSYNKYNQAKFIRIRFDVFKEQIDYVKLYKGTDTDDYYEFCEINGARDEYNISTGKIIKRTGKVVLDGSESGWNINGYANSKGIYIFNIQYKDMSITATSCISDKFKNKIWNDNNILEDDNAIFISQNVILIKLKDQTIKTIDDFKNWLSENNLIIEYDLAEPYEIEVEPIEMTPFEGTNIIEISDKYNLIDDMEITYFTTWKDIANN